MLEGILTASRNTVIAAVLAHLYSGVSDRTSTQQHLSDTLRRRIRAASCPLPYAARFYSERPRLKCLGSIFVPVRVLWTCSQVRPVQVKTEQAIDNSNATDCADFGESSKPEARASAAVLKTEEMEVSWKVEPSESEELLVSENSRCLDVFARAGTRLRWSCS